MTDSVTINYSWAYPTNGADDSTWGTTLNAAIIAIDASLKTVDNKTVGAALVANNLSDLTSASTARTNLGLGNASIANVTNAGAPLAAMFGASIANNIPIFINSSGSIEDGGIASTDILQKSANLSGLSSTSTSRTNLGLGSMSTRNYSSGTGAPSGGSSGDLYGQHS